MPSYETNEHIQSFENDKEPAGHISEGLLSNIMSVTHQAAYHWDLQNDTLDWSENIKKILELDDLETVKTGPGFGLHIDAEHSATRYDMITESHAHKGKKSRAYQNVFCFYPKGRGSDHRIWIEEKGRCYLGEDGQVSHAFGVVAALKGDENLYLKQHFANKEGEEIGLVSRQRLLEHLEKHMISNVKEKNIGFLLVAIRNLSQINETSGFDIGDEVISAIGGRLRQFMREDDLICRFSSNQYAIIIHDCVKGDLEVATQRFIQAIRDQVIGTSTGPVSATISIGGLELLENDHSLNKVIASTMEALDSALDKTYDCFEPYKHGQDIDLIRRRNMEISKYIMDALNEKRMLLALQPIVNSTTEVVSFYEILLRIQNPDGSIISAGEFIPIAEQLGMSRLIDYRVLELSILYAKKTPDVDLSLNISGLTCGDKEWVDMLGLLLHNDKDLAKRLMIEITETAVIEDIDVTIDFVQKVKKLGCKVAIDDFGAGYTSYKSIRQLDVDVVKIDGNFIENITKNKKDQIIVKSLITLCNELGIETVAEFVTDQDAADMLREFGVTYLQGFFFGKPVLLDSEKNLVKQATNAA